MYLSFFYHSDLWWKEPFGLDNGIIPSTFPIQYASQLIKLYTDDEKDTLANRFLAVADLIEVYSRIVVNLDPHITPNPEQLHVIANTSQNCFAIAFMEILVRRTEFVDLYLNGGFISSGVKDPSENKHVLVTMAVYNLMRRVHKGENNVDLDQLMVAVNLVSDGKFPDGEHQDPSEFMAVLMESLHLSFLDDVYNSNGNPATPASNIFRGEQFNKLVCTNPQCGSSNVTKDDMWQIFIMPDESPDSNDNKRRGNKSFDVGMCLNRQCEDEQVECRCARNCGSESKSKTISFIMPRIISLSLVAQKVSFDSTNNTPVKLSKSKWSTPHKLDSRRYLPPPEFTTGRRVTNDKSVYELVGVINHGSGGDAMQGHYYTHVKIGSQWYNFNGKRVLKVQPDTASKSSNMFSLVYCLMNPLPSTATIATAIGDDAQPTKKIKTTH